jgi:hypothetical protein
VFEIGDRRLRRLGRRHGIGSRLKAAAKLSPPVAKTYPS